MTLYIGRNSNGNIESRIYKTGSPPPGSSFKTPRELIERVEFLEALLQKRRNEEKTPGFEDFLRGFMR